jgi:Haem-NO-binding
MHGLIFSELKRFVDEGHGPGVWDALLRESGIGAKIYLTMEVYPDAELERLARTASALTGSPLGDILEAFGEFLAPTYFKLYGHLLKPEWRTLEVIEHTEQSIHRVVRIKNPGARPPELRCVRISSVEVLLVYNSSRRMCAVAKGIAKGVATHFSESIRISESTCMLRGATDCRITIKLA